MDATVQWKNARAAVGTPYGISESLRRQGEVC